MSAGHDEWRPAITRLPEVRTIADLRRALSRYGFPGDHEKFDQHLNEAMESAPLGDLEEVIRVVDAYRHRLLIRNSPELMEILENTRPPGRTE